MKNLLLVFCFAVTTVHAQTTESYRLVDSLTGASVPYGVVFDRVEKNGLITDDAGVFQLPPSANGHKYLATSIGYDTTWFTAGASVKVIKLAQRPYLLKGVTISSCTKTERWGASTKRPLFLNGFFSKIGGEVARFMPNESKKAGKIQKIRFYLGKEGYPQTRFRAKIYGVDSIRGGPGRVLNQQDILLSATKGNEWVEYDVAGMNISIPPNGFFVSMVWLPEGKSYRLYNGKDAPTGIGQFLVGTKASPHTDTWIQGALMGQWLKLSEFRNPDNEWTNVMISADILTSCEVSDKKH